MTQKLNIDHNLENADWIKKGRDGKAQEEDLQAHEDAEKLHEEEAESD